VTFTPEELLIKAGKAHNVAVVVNGQAVIDTPAAHLVLRPALGGVASFNSWIWSITAGKANDNSRTPRPAA
jgi:hypothetical protein